MEENAKIDYSLIEVKRLLSHNHSSMPWDWDIDLYRGCEQRCIYCNTQNSFQELTQIQAKSNAPELLRRTLSAPSWRGESIHFGNMTDPFQPLDAQLQLSRQCLEVIEEFPTPLFITTQSELILNHLDLLKRISQKVPVTINVTITTLDEALRENIEPGSPSGERRFKILDRCKKAGCHTQLFLMPVIPFLTDNGKNLEKIIRRVAKFNTDSLFAWTLELPEPLYENYLSFLEKNYPEWLTPTRDLYENPNKMRVYRRNLFALITNLMKKYSVNFPDLSNTISLSDNEDFQPSLFNDNN